MKQIVTQICGLILGTGMVLFCLRILMGDMAENGMELMSRAAARCEIRDVISENGERLEELLKKPKPQVRLKNMIYRAGEAYSPDVCVQVRQNGDAGWAPPGKADGYRVVIQQIKNKTTGLCIRFEGNAFVFPQGGCYEVQMKVIGPYGRYVRKKVTIPVEEEQGDL